MKKMLIKIENTAHSEEVQKALFKLGYSWQPHKDQEIINSHSEVIWAYEDGGLSYSEVSYAKFHGECEGHEWVTLVQLIDMIIDKLNNTVLGDVVEEDKINPKQAHGLASLPLTLFSQLATAYGCVGKLNGKLKYGLSNYLGTEVILSIYVDAIRRHLDKFMSGEEYDIADGVPHFAAILANIDIILCARAAGTLVDDRPMIKGYQDEIAELTKIAQNLHVIHKDKNPKHYYLQELE